MSLRTARWRGNQLAVFTDARGLSAETMQRLANEMHFSETTFVFPAEQGGHAKVRIFTPQAEMPFAGHPTLGTSASRDPRCPSPATRTDLRIFMSPSRRARK